MPARRETQGGQKMTMMAAARHVPSETLRQAREYIGRGWALVPFSPQKKNSLFDLLSNSEKNKKVK